MLIKCSRAVGQATKLGLDGASAGAAVGFGSIEKRGPGQLLRQMIELPVSN